MSGEGEEVKREPLYSEYKGRLKKMSRSKAKVAGNEDEKMGWGQIVKFLVFIFKNLFT